MTPGPEGGEAGIRQGQVMPYWMTLSTGSLHTHPLSLRWAERQEADVWRVSSGEGTLGVESWSPWTSGIRATAWLRLALSLAAANVTSGCRLSSQGFTGCILSSWDSYLPPSP